MSELNPVHEPTSSPRDRRAYPLIAISAATGIFFFIYYRFLELTLSSQIITSVIVGLTLGVPLVLGYTGYPFWEGTIPGILPLLGVRLGTWIELPITYITLRNLVNSVVINTSQVLPVVAIVYIVGVGLRDRDALSERARPLAIRLAGTVLLLIAVFVAHSMGSLRVGALD